MRSAVWLVVVVALGLACGSDAAESAEPNTAAGTGAGGASEAAASLPSGGSSPGNVTSRNRDATAAAGSVSSVDAGMRAALSTNTTTSSSSGNGGSTAVAGAVVAGSGGMAAMASQAGSGNSAMSVGSAGAAGGDAAMATPGEPKIPAIQGDCPMFASGTATIGGLRGITVQVGEVKAEKGPLLFYWHGTGQTAGMVNSSVPNDVRDEILEAGGIIISPSGSLGTGGDCSGTGTFYKDDFNVADLIVACGVKDHNIDPRRIYTTGCSAGGLHAGCMANMRASYLAAAAPNSGGIIGMQPKDDPHVPALITMHGGPGDVVIVTFSETSKTLYTAFAAMGGTVVNCNHGGGHCGAPAALQRAAWKFMKDNPFGAPSPYTSGLPSEFPQYCEIIK